MLLVKYCSTESIGIDMKNVKSLFLKGGFICAFMFSALSSTAENYPYRSDVLWVTVPDHADWLYKMGEKAQVEVQFYKYGIPQDRSRHGAHE